jgi:hypothetical protein
MPPSIVSTVASGVGLRGRVDAARRLQRFPARYRNSVNEVADRHDRLADLARSFPALLFALAAPRPGFDPSFVIDGVIAGASLRNLAQLAGLPVWSRKLMPEAFEQPLCGLPSDKLVGRQISNHLPRSPKLAARWLYAVNHVTMFGTPAAAVWIAREIANNPKDVFDARLNLVALYVWFSSAPQTPAGELIEKVWTPSMRFSTAVHNARNWFEAVALRAHFAGQPISDTWLSSVVVDGFEFVPLCSEGDIGDEAEAMQNCVRSLSWGLRQNRLRLWSVRREGERVATLQLGRRYGDPLLQVVQLKGPKNATAPAPIWWAARKWLHGHDLSVIAPMTFKEALPIDRRGWIELWRPYWIAKQRLPAWLPLAPSAKAISDLKH